MTQRIAAIVALLAFALCLIAGGMHAGNTFSTTVLRALLALVGTYMIGLIVGVMAQKMVDENLKTENENLKNSRTDAGTKDR